MSDSTVLPVEVTGEPAGSGGHGSEPAGSGGHGSEPTTRVRSQKEMLLRRFLRHRAAMASLALFGLVVLFAFVGPLTWPYDHTFIGDDLSSPPSLRHPFGTDQLGHDTMAQVMRGAQQSIKIALLVAVVATGAGALWGSVAGLYRGVADALMMRLVDVLLILPAIAVAAALSGSIGNGGWLAVATILGSLTWPYVSRVVRGTVLSLREQEFVEAARALGASDTRIIVRHLLPNAIGPIVVTATILVAGAILGEAGLSFLGLGVRTPDTSLGLLVSGAKDALNTRPWLFYFPGAFIILIALTISFIGDGLRDAFDPRQQRGRS